MYYEYRGYAARFLSTESGDDWHPGDRRWNKIRSVIKALGASSSSGVDGEDKDKADSEANNPNAALDEVEAQVDPAAVGDARREGWAATQQAIVFVDADLVVLDWRLDVKEVLHAHPRADLIMSADALDSANTGFLVVRNSAWSRAFFLKWWRSRFLKHTFCDQVS